MVAPLTAGPSVRAPDRPSALYRAHSWRVGLALTRLLPHRVMFSVARTAASFYAQTCRARREIVITNLLPVLDYDRERAERAAANLFRNFAVKLLDLWRFEAGLAIKHLFTRLDGHQHYEAAVKSGRGVLLLTPHLGNWEFGAPLLTMNGSRLHVITLVEPGRGFTELRQAARARWGIETLVIGHDPFAFIEIIRRLETGANVALLVDRPSSGSSVEVQLFGQPFRASLAAAELARATGCELLPVCLLREAAGYSAHVLPRIQYDRAALRDRTARQQLTQSVMDVFVPLIREHPDQWYHFVPVWRSQTVPDEGKRE